MFGIATKRIGFAGLLRGQDVKVRRNLKDLSFFYTALLVSLAVILVVFLYLWSRLMVVNIGYEISKANTSRTGLIEKNKRLRLEYIKLKSPERIERIAQEEFSLSYPSGDQIVQIR